jgi:putative membrane-bound dehydrogenase-like protein
VKRSSISLIAFAAVGGATFLLLPPSAPDAETTRVPQFVRVAGQGQPDLKWDQSPAKPKPQWVDYIDQGDNDPRLKGYFTPQGVKLEIVAEEPTVVNPVGMTFGPDGTLYVLEWVPAEGAAWPESSVTFTYKDGTKRKVAIMRKPVRDRVKVLTLGGDGKVYDKARVVLEDELPSSILIHEDWLYLTGQGTVRRYPLSALGDKEARPQVIAQGFCGFHHHQVSGLTIGNDGWLYVTSGDDDNVVEGSDSSRATVLRTGAVFRCRPDGSKMQAFAMGFRNPYRDAAFDDAFNMFHADNDNEDGSKFQGCRLMHIAEGCDFGWRLRIGARCCQPDFVRGAAFGELPGKMAPMLKTGRGAPAGLLIYNETRFPKQYRGLLYYPDVFRKLIRAYKVEPEGATFKVVNEFEFLKTDDPLFRPCQMVVGPDGAMYICDWRTNSGGAGRLWGDGQHGRIYRVTWAGTKNDPALEPRGMDSWAKIQKMDASPLLETLSSEEFSDRQLARRRLVSLGDKNRPALLKLLTDDKALKRARIAALGALQSMWNTDVQTACIGLLKNPDADYRRLAADALGLNSPAKDAISHEALNQAILDPDALVRRSIALAMSRVGADGAEDVLVSTLQNDSGKDEFLFDGLIRAVENLGKRGIDKLVGLSDNGEPRDLQRVIEAFQALRTRPAYDALPALLKNYHLAPEQKAALLQSFTNYLLDPPISMEPVADYLLALPKAPPRGSSVPPKVAKELQALAPVKLAGLETLSTGGLLGDPKVQQLLLRMLDEPSTEIRVAVIKAIAETRLAKAGPSLAEDLGEAGTPPAEKIAIVKALGTLHEKQAIAPLKAILQDARLAQSAQGPELRLESLRALAAIEPPAAHDFAVSFLDATDAPLRVEAIQILTATPEGAKLVGQRFLDKKLPRDLLPQVADGLRKHTDKQPELAVMLTEVMKGGLLVSLDAAEIARIDKLVSTKGNARRGRELYLNNSKLACITCHRLEGVGGNVGPDLTRVWDTQSLPKLIESIIDPSKEIKEGYQSYIATTTKGQVYTGLKVSQTPDEVVLRDATAKEIRISTKDLDTLVVSKKSLMPDDVVRHLSFDQFLDLVAFLRNREVQEQLRGMCLEFWVIGPFTPAATTDAQIEKAPDPKQGVPVDKAAGPSPWDKDAGPLTWAAKQADARGYLDIKAILGKDKVHGYALTYLYVPQAEKIRMFVGCAGSMRVWSDGKEIYNSGPRTAKPDDAVVEVPLEAGWHPVLVRVADEQGAIGVFLRFAGSEGLRVSLRPQ